MIILNQNCQNEKRLLIIINRVYKKNIFFLHKWAKQHKKLLQFYRNYYTFGFEQKSGPIV